MAHIINPISVKPRMLKNKLNILSCQPKCPKNMIHDKDAINERIQEAAIIKQQLEADTFEQNNRIKQCSEAAKKI